MCPPPRTGYASRPAGRSLLHIPSSRRPSVIWWWRPLILTGDTVVPLRPVLRAISDVTSCSRLAVWSVATVASRFVGPSRTTRRGPVPRPTTVHPSLLRPSFLGAGVISSPTPAPISRIVALIVVAGRVEVLRRRVLPWRRLPAWSTTVRAAALESRRCSTRPARRRDPARRRQNPAEPAPPFGGGTLRPT